MRLWSEHLVCDYKRRSLLVLKSIVCLDKLLTTPVDADDFDAVGTGDGEAADAEADEEGDDGDEQSEDSDEESEDKGAGRAMRGGSEGMRGRGPGAGRGGGPGGARNAGGRFERMDADGDGKLARTEFPGPDEMFDRLDENDDGGISQEEMQAGLSRRGVGGRGRGDGGDGGQ